MLFHAALAVPGMLLSNVTAFQLLVAGSLLLAVAALLLALSRVRRVSVKPSPVTEELAILMGRIANALENLANPLRDRSHFTDSRGQAPVAPGKTTEEARHVAYSIFGR
jgi:membrane protein implicated in regulation of membrane protease activity